MKDKKTKPAALDVETLWQIDRIGSLALAPGGEQAVCSVVSYSMAKNQGSSSLWLLSTTGGAPRRLTSCGDKDGQPAWSPGGDRIAFVAKRDQQGQDKTPQLYLIAADGGEAQRASNFAPGIESFKWLPDGKRIVFAAWVWPELKGSAAQARRHKEFSERKETGYASSQAYTRYWDHHVPMGRVLHLLLLDLQSGRVSDLFEGTGCELPRDAAGNEVYDPSPDGSRIAFVHDPAGEQRLGNRLVLAQVRLKGRRRIETLLDDAAWEFGAPRFSPDGKQLAMTAAHVGKQHTALAEPALLQAGGRWRLLAPGWDHSLNAPLRWTSDGSGVYFTAEERGRCHLWQLRLDDATPRIAQAGGWVQAFDAAGGALLWAADSAVHPAQVFACSEQLKSTVRRIEHFNRAVLKRVRFGDVRELEIRGAGGAPVQMWLTFPPGFDARRKKPYPVTQVIHGGPFAAAGDTFSYRWNPHVFAAAGHVVAQVNYHGSSGFGLAFRHSLIGRQGELELQDIEAATRWLLAQPWADHERVFATGGSYGGFLVAWMNGHVPAWPEGPYRAYVCHAGVFDRVATFSADSWPQRPLDLGAKYWEDMPRVLAQSPHHFAARMNTPTLVIHGALDFRVPDHNGLAYYNTLKARGVDARLLWFPDENHWVLKPRNSRLWYREFAAWLQAQSPRKGNHNTKRSKQP